MILYDYFRSTACYRVRIALNLKGISYEKISIHLVEEGGQQHSQAYRSINPQELVPTLKIDGKTLTQSLAIIDYLEETIPTPPLLPKDPVDKAQVRSLALLIACDMHPLNNLRVLNYLKSEFEAKEAHITQWYHHWLKAGFSAFEAKLHTRDSSSNFCFGDCASLADLCLIPQVFNAHRFNFLMDDYPLINKIYAHCLTIKAFQM